MASHEGETSSEPIFTSSGEDNVADIIALIAHELRSPLSVVLGAARMIERSKRYLPNQVNSIIQAGKRQDRIINDILTIAELGVEGLDLYKKNFDINELIKDYLQNIGYLTDYHRAVFCPGEPLIVNSDPMRIEQVLDKLVSNAIKYSPNGGDIELNVANKPGLVQVSVKDQGVGIASEYLTPALFEHRSRFKTEAGAPGLGFGLYVARAIVLAHGGEIWAESEGENRGSTFHFTLPF